jgi:molybdenum cofactor cytidylyltransferase
VTVAGVVLAAGTSTRMGRNKLLLPLDGESLVRRATRAALEAGLAPVIVVLGHESELVAQALTGLDCTLVVNGDYESGPGTSVSAGVARASHSPAEALVLLLADMPFVTAAMLSALVTRWRETEAPLVISRYGDAQAPPTLFGRALFEELMDVDETTGAKPVIAEHAASAAVVEWPASALQDLDVAADYEAVKDRLSRR